MEAVNDHSGRARAAQAGRRGTEEAHAARCQPATAAEARAALRGDITGPEADWAIASYLARSAAALRHAPGPGRQGGGSGGGTVSTLAELVKAEDTADAQRRAVGRIPEVLRQPGAPPMTPTPGGKPPIRR